MGTSIFSRSLKAKGIIYLFISLLAFTILFPVSGKAESVVLNYKVIFLVVCDFKGNFYFATRQYYQNNQKHFLVVDPTSFRTKTGFSKNFKIIDTTSADIFDSNNANFLNSLRRYTAPPYTQRNYGISRAELPVRGMFLTIDLCPSKKPLDKRLFQFLNKWRKTGDPFPISIAVSGKWIVSHPDDFKWLINLINSGIIDVTWINHSFSHPFDPTKPLNHNFLMTQGTNFSEEILSVEKILLQYGQSPSVFFRFPGLISNQSLIETLFNFSLIPIGSDAWLAKNQFPVCGSFILIHGNGNEEKGVQRLFYLLRRKNHLRCYSVEKKPSFFFLPLTKAFLP